MSNRLPRLLAASAFMFIGLVSMAHAQMAGFTLHVEDPKIQIYPEFETATIDYEVIVTNTSLDTITMYIERTMNDLPSAKWTSSVCTGVTCYLPEQSKFVPFKIAGGETDICKLTMSSPIGGDEKAHVALSFKAGAFGTPVSKEFNVSAPTGTSGVNDPIVAAINVSAYPNPASVRTTLSLPQSISGTVQLHLFNAQGEAVMNLTDAARTAVASNETALPVDLSSLAAGVYYYEFIAGGATRRGSIVVAR